MSFPTPRVLLPNPLQPQTLYRFSKPEARPYIVVALDPEHGDFGPFTPGTQTAGLQEAVNAAAALGVSKVLIRSGTYNLGPFRGNINPQAPIAIPNGVKIEGENRYATVLASPQGYFTQQSANPQNIAVKRLTMVSKAPSGGPAGSGGYFLVLNASGGTIQNVSVEELTLLGGGNVGTGPFNIGGFTAMATLSNVKIRNVYMDTQGTTAGNEAVTFPNAYFEYNCVLEDFAPINSSGPGIGIFQTYGGILKIRKTDFTNSAGGYVNVATTSSGAPAVLSSLKLVIEDCINPSFTTGGQGVTSAMPIIPIELVMRGITVHRSTTFNILSPAGQNVWVNSIDAEIHVAQNAAFLMQWSAPSIRLRLFAAPGWNAGGGPPFTILNLSPPVNNGQPVNLDIDGLVGPLGSNAAYFSLLQVQYTSASAPALNVRIRGIWPLSQATQQVILMNNLSTSTLQKFAGLHAFEQAWAAFPSIFQNVDADYLDATSFSRVRTTTPAIAANPPTSGVTYQNVNDYGIVLLIPVALTPTSTAAASASIAVGTSPSSLSTVQTLTQAAGAGPVGGVLQAAVPSGQYYQITLTNATAYQAIVLPE